MLAVSHLLIHTFLGNDQPCKDVCEKTGTKAKECHSPNQPDYRGINVKISSEAAAYASDLTVKYASCDSIFHVYLSFVLYTIKYTDED
jgi:hypothetical protein